MNKIQQIGVGFLALSILTTFPPETVTKQEKLDLENLSTLSIVGSAACFLLSNRLERE